MTRAWNHNSAVTACPECDGHGVVASDRTPSISDPYPERRCSNACEEHLPECEVCGFDQVVTGYDCFACETVAALTDSDYAAFNPDAFAAAVKAAVTARMQGERKAA